MSQNAAPDKARWPETTNGLNYFETDANLHAVLRRIAPGLLLRQEAALGNFGEWVASVLEEQARYSDRHAPPVLVNAQIRPGERRAHVQFNPLYEETHREAYRRGVIGQAFRMAQREPHLLSFLIGYILSKADISTHCPVTMTGAVAYVIDKYASPEVKEKYLHHATRMDGLAKTGGTWCTEKHSGTDIGGTTCIARKNDDGTWRLYGQKEFASNAASGMVIATARPEGAPAGNKGVGLYIVCSHIDEGWTVPNDYKITHLKEKIGTHGLATAEIDLNGCRAIELVPPPHGLRVAMEALGYSRVHNAMAAAGVLHRAYLESLCWTDNRAPFGTRLTQQPMIQKNLADIAAEWMGSVALSFESARSFDESQGNGKDAVAWMRLVTAIAKHRTAEQAERCATLAIELHGGIGYTKDKPIERVWRDAMVLLVWEGPRHVQAREAMNILLQYNAAPLFSARLEAITQSLPVEMKKEQERLTRQLKKLSGHFRAIEARRDLAPQVADDMLTVMGNVLTYALLCQEAAFELTAEGNKAKLLATRQFYQKNFTLPSVTLKPGELQSLFNRFAAPSQTPGFIAAKLPSQPQAIEP